MPVVFISYRREDAAAHAGRLHDRLVSLLGSDAVFLDVQDIHPGADFRQTIEDTVAKCNVVLVVIGPHWLASLEARAGGEDLVSAEICAALAAKRMVIPVLVGGAGMPSQNELPEILRPLTHYEALEIRDSRFEDGFQQLAALLGPSLQTAAFDLNGKWIAEMKRTDAFAVREGFAPFRAELDFYVVDGVIGGSVTYPTGAAFIEEGVVTGRRVTFRTSHVPQFDSKRAIIRFMGEIVADELHLRSVDERGLACSGIARRAGAASQS